MNHENPSPAVSLQLVYAFSKSGNPIPNLAEPERSQTVSQGVTNPAREALWLKLVLNPASTKPVFIVTHTAPAPHNNITFPSKRSTSITTQACRAQTRRICGCATTARPGGPPLSAVLWWATTATTAMPSARFGIHRCSRPWLFVSPHARHFLLVIMCVSRVSRYSSYSQERTFPRPSGR